jgi:hypothetical protein
MLRPAKSVFTESWNRCQLIQTTPGIAQLGDPLWVLEKKKMSVCELNPRPTSETLRNF